MSTHYATRRYMTAGDLEILSFTGRFGAATLAQLSRYLGREETSLRLRIVRALAPSGYATLRNWVNVKRRSARRETIVSITVKAAAALEHHTGRARESWVTGEPKFEEIEHALLHNEAYIHVTAHLAGEGYRVRETLTHKALMSDLQRRIASGQADPAGRGQLTDFLLVAEKDSDRLEVPVEVAIHYSEEMIRTKHRFAPDTVWVTPSPAQARTIEAVTERPAALVERPLHPADRYDRAKNLPAFRRYDRFYQPSEVDTDILSALYRLGGTATRAQTAAMLATSRTPALPERTFRRRVERLRQNGYLEEVPLPGPFPPGRLPTRLQLKPRGSAWIGERRWGKQAWHPHVLGIEGQIAQASAVVALAKAGWYATVSREAQQRWIEDRLKLIAQAHNEKLLAGHELELKAWEQTPTRARPEYPAHRLWTVERLLEKLPHADLKSPERDGIERFLTLGGILSGRPKRPGARPSPAERPTLLVCDAGRAAPSRQLAQLAKYSDLKALGVARLVVAVPSEERAALWEAAVADARLLERRSKTTTSRVFVYPDSLVVISDDYGIHPRQVDPQSSKEPA